MKFLWLLFCVSLNFVDVCPALTSEEAYEVQETCCNFGDETAGTLPSISSCGTQPLPEDIEHEQVDTCRTVALSCCQQVFKKKDDCDAGIQMAHSRRCSIPNTDIGKTCCEECSFGQWTGESQGKEACGSAVQDDVSQDTRLRKNAFFQCCVKAAVKPETTTEKRTTTSTTTTTTTTTPKPTTPKPTTPKPTTPKPTTVKPTTEKPKPKCKKDSCEHDCDDRDGVIRCSCKEGFRLQGDKKSCKDINECAETQDDLCTAEDTVCHNIPGAFKCVPIKKREVGGCPPGFKKNVKNQVCDDINECQLPRPPCPKYLCENTIGGYKCGGKPGKPFEEVNPGTVTEPAATESSPKNDICPQGFRAGLYDDCNDIDECMEMTDDCQHLSQHCINTHGSFFCQDHVSKRCAPGFMFNTSTGICEDIDECEETVDVCRKNEVCVNLPGAYSCRSKISTLPKLATKTCQEGTRLRPGGKNCEDIDECREGSHLCDQFQNCINTYGGHECRCKNGFELDSSSGSCVDIDECALKLDNCSPGLHCLNVLGSFTCTREAVTSSTTTTTTPIPIYEYEYSDYEDENSTTDDTPDPVSVPIKPATTPRPKPTTSRPTTTSTNTPKPTTIKPSRPYQPDRPRYPTRRPYPTRKPTTPAPEETPENPPTTPEDRRPVNYNPNRTENPTESSRTPEETPSRPVDYPRRPTFSPFAPERPVNTPRPEDYPRRPEDTTKPEDYPSRPEDYPSRPEDYPSRPEDYPRRPEDTPKPEDYPRRPEDYPRTPDDYPRRPDDYPRRPNDYPRRPDDYPRRPDNTPRPEDHPRRPENTPRRPEDYPRRPEETPEDYPRRPDDSSRRPEDYPRRPTTSRRPYYPSRKPTSTPTPTTTGKATPGPETSGFDPNDVHCLYGYEKDNYGNCIDVNECDTGTHVCGRLETCMNRPGGYSCECLTGFRRGADGWCAADSTTSSTSTTTSTTTERSTTESTTAVATSPEWPYHPHTPRMPTRGRGYQPMSCELGFNFDNNQGKCVDIDECATNKNTCSGDEECVNLEGGFRCYCGKKCRAENERPPYVPAQPQPHKPSDPSSNVITVGAQYGQRGGWSPRPSHARLPDSGAIVLSCPWGYKLTPDNRCYDIDECTKNVSKCGPEQRCENFYGGYSCQCPAGHRLVGQNSCEDIDECVHGNPCAYNAQCINTIGSYRCKCSDGFRNAASNDKVCVDIDECAETPAVCEHGCANAWGGYRCYCSKGYRLHKDNKTCVDVNECEEWSSVRIRGKLCGGECVNEAGSYRCTCPRGYRLAEDHRSCIDIDECESGEATCAHSGDPGFVCQNTRGRYHCHHIDCPRGYQLESRHRCARTQRSCSVTDWSCLQRPSSYSYNFITFVANIYLPSGSVDLFTMHGPAWSDSVVSFEMRMIKVQASKDVHQADLRCFDMRPNNNICVISLLCSLEGPQVAELELTMSLYQRGMFAGSTVARLIVIVSEYDF